MTDFSRNLSRLRKEKGLTMEELANDLNKKYGTKFNKSSISKYENGKSATNKNASILASYFGVTLDEMIGLSSVVKEEPVVYTVNNQVPILGTVAAGEPMFAEQNILGYAPAPPMVNVKSRNVFFLQIKGESMNREFKNGSFVLIDRDAQVENGDIACVLVNGDEATVKKIVCQDNLLTLIPMSTDESFYPVTINLEKEEVTIIGKIIGAFKMY